MKYTRLEELMDISRYQVEIAGMIIIAISSGVATLAAKYVMRNDVVVRQPPQNQSKTR